MIKGCRPSEKEVKIVWCPEKITVKNRPQTPASSSMDQVWHHIACTSDDGT